jgi:hemoglobin
MMISTRRRGGGRAGLLATSPHDLDDPDEVRELVRRFYADVAQDDLLGPLFNDVAHVTWSEHLPKLTAFWCRFLFGQQGYAGNPFRAHKAIHDQAPFTTAHFRRWLELFEATLSFGWVGPTADRVLTLAHDVARVHHHQLIGETTPRGDGGSPRTSSAR